MSYCYCWWAWPSCSIYFYFLFSMLWLNLWFFNFRFHSESFVQDGWLYKLNEQTNNKSFTVIQNNPARFQNDTFKLDRKVDGIQNWKAQTDAKQNEYPNIYVLMIKDCISPMFSHHISKVDSNSNFLFLFIFQIYMAACRDYMLQCSNLQYIFLSWYGSLYIPLHFNRESKATTELATVVFYH